MLSAKIKKVMRQFYRHFRILGQVSVSEKTRKEKREYAKGESLLKILVWSFFLLHGSPLQAQCEQKDVVDCAKDVLKINSCEKPDSLKLAPHKVFYSVLPGVGYKLVTRLSAVASINAAFYLGRIHDTYLSSVSTYSEYSFRNHQIIIPIISNIWTNGNGFNWQGDLRYYKYPTYTYGLGGNSAIANTDKVDYSYYRIYQEVLKKIRSSFYAGLGYNLDYHQKIKDQGIGDFQSYTNGATSTNSSGLVLHFLFDKRQNINNPPLGYYASFSYRSNFRFLGSDQNWQSLILDCRKYIKLPFGSENILAFWSYDWFTFGGKVPYFDLPSTGWDTYSNMGREYIQGRLRGTSLVYLEAEYRFRITRNGLLGGVVFANAQSVPDYPAGRFETVLPGGGVGLRVKVNTLSRANLGIDYGLGIEGSPGIFFHLCEIF
jgi:hypothetical protein